MFVALQESVPVVDPSATSGVLSLLWVIIALPALGAVATPLNQLSKVGRGQASELLLERDQLAGLGGAGQIQKMCCVPNQRGAVGVDLLGRLQNQRAKVCELTLHEDGPLHTSAPGR